MANYKVCNVCGNPDISSFWSRNWRGNFYCSFKCSAYASRYGAILIGLVLLAFLYNQILGFLQNINTGISVNQNEGLLFVALLVPSIFFLLSLYGFTAHIEYYDSTPSTSNSSSTFNSNSPYIRISRINNETKICPHCGTEIRGDHVYCPNCGTDLSQ